MELTKRLINSNEVITVISHVHPDGDAVGSLLGLQLGLEQLGKNVHPVLHDPVPQVFSFLPKALQPITGTFPNDPGLVIVVDLNDVVRTGFLPEVQRLAKEQKVITIDHHPKGDLSRLSVASIHNEHASSTAEIVYALLVELEVKITSPIATALLTGIYTDTGGFQYPNTTTRTLEIAAELMRRGARLGSIARNISHTKSVAGLKLLGLALERLRLTHDGTCAVSVLTYEDITSCNALPEDVSGIIGEINVLPTVRCSMLLTEIEPGAIRGTLRTGEGYKIKVNHLAKLLGGGGHPRAAGFLLPGKIVIDEAHHTWTITEVAGS